MKREGAIEVFVMDEPMLDHIGELDFSLKYVKSVYAVKKGLIPTVVGIKKDKRFVVMAQWANKEEKYGMVEAIKKFFKKEEVEVIVFMTEAWCVVARNPALMSGEIMPSEHPARQEILVISYISKDKYLSRTYPILRDDNDMAEIGMRQHDLSDEGDDFKVVDNLWGDFFKKGDK